MISKRVFYKQEIGTVLKIVEYRFCGIKICRKTYEMTFPDKYDCEILNRLVRRG